MEKADASKVYTWKTGTPDQPSIGGVKAPTGKESSGPVHQESVPGGAFYSPDAQIAPKGTAGNS